MSGIPIHTSSPINPTQAAKPDGITPQTTDPASKSQPTSTTASTYLPATTSNASSYPAAQPGAVPGPAPTGSAYATPTRTLPSNSTTSIQGSPPPPQPGATPVASNTNGLTVSRPSIPPPPKAGEVAPLLPHQQYGTLSDPTQAMRAQPPAAVTSSVAGTAGAPTADLSHPPGYRQNSQASFDDRPLDPYQPFQNQSGGSGAPASAKPGDGLLGAANVPAVSEDDEGKGFWDTAGDWAKKAGEKLSEGHDEIWRRINNEK